MSHCNCSGTQLDDRRFQRSKFRSIIYIYICARWCRTLSPMFLMLSAIASKRYSRQRALSLLCARHQVDRQGPVLSAELLATSPQAASANWKKWKKAHGELWWLLYHVNYTTLETWICWRYASKRWYGLHIICAHGCRRAQLWHLIM